MYNFDCNLRRIVVIYDGKFTLISNWSLKWWCYNSPHVTTLPALTHSRNWRANQWRDKDVKHVFLAAENMKQNETDNRKIERERSPMWFPITIQCLKILKPQRNLIKSRTNLNTEQLNIRNEKFSYIMKKRSSQCRK